MDHQSGSFGVVVGHSDELDSRDAIDKIVEQCREQLGGRVPVAGLLHASIDYEHDVLLERLAEAWPALALIGGTTDGELSGEHGFQPDSVLLTLLVGSGLEAAMAVADDLSLDVHSCVERALAQLPDKTPKLLITNFSPSTNASEVLRELHAQLGTRACPVIGGLSGDHREFVKMVEFAGSKARVNSFPILALYGDFHASWGVASGWFPVGTNHRVTRSDGHMVYEIDDRPAVEIYKHYYKELALESLGEYPLAMYVGDGEQDFVLRAVLESWPDKECLRFAGEVPEGAIVRMTEVLPEGILDGSRRSVEAALCNYKGSSPELTFLFSCAARQWALGGRAEEELETVRSALPKRAGRPIQIAGFYAFGEILPGPDGGASRFHNETCVSLLLGK